MSDVLDCLSAEDRDRARRRGPPRFRPPMLATLVHEPFSDPDWIFERKLDGQRVLAVVRGGR